MHKLRSHIVKLFAATLIWVGFGLYVVQPAQGKSSTQSFASWLAQVVEKADTSELAKEVNRLKDSGVELSVLIEHASHIISKNNEGFKLPLKGASGSHQIYQILLTQWSNFHTGSGMGNIPPPESVKTGLNLHVDKFNTMGYGKQAGDRNPEPDTDFSAEPVAERLPFKESVTPMATGIAIGAP